MRLKGLILLTSLFTFTLVLSSSANAQQNRVPAGRMPAGTEKRTEAKTEKKKHVKLQKKKKAGTEKKLKAESAKRQKAATQPKVMYKR